MARVAGKVAGNAGEQAVLAVKEALGKDAGEVLPSTLPKLVSRGRPWVSCMRRATSLPRHWLLLTMSQATALQRLDPGEPWRTGTVVYLLADGLYIRCLQAGMGAGGKEIGAAPGDEGRQAAAGLLELLSSVGKARVAEQFAVKYRQSVVRFT